MDQQAMDNAALQAKIDALMAENATLKTTAQNKRYATVTLRISEKGCIVVYGLGRFPTSLYKQQWRKLLSMKDSILAYIDENEAILPDKS